MSKEYKIIPSFIICHGKPTKFRLRLSLRSVNQFVTSASCSLSVLPWSFLNIATLNDEPISFVELYFARKTSCSHGMYCHQSKRKIAISTSYIQLARDNYLKRFGMEYFFYRTNVKSIQRFDKKFYKSYTNFYICHGKLTKLHLRLFILHGEPIRDINKLLPIDSRLAP